MLFVPKHRRLVACCFRKINGLAIAFGMYQTLQSSSPDRGSGRFMIWVGLFGSFTYLVLSAWAQTVFGARYLWMSDVRLVSIAGGTLLYAQVLRAAMRSRAEAGGPAMLALYVAGASLIMLVLRYVTNRALSDTPLPIGEHIVWVLVWGGLFRALGQCVFADGMAKDLCSARHMDPCRSSRGGRKRRNTGASASAGRQRSRGLVMDHRRAGRRDVAPPAGSASGIAEPSAAPRRL